MGNPSPTPGKRPEPTPGGRPGSTPGDRTESVSVQRVGSVPNRTPRPGSPFSDAVRGVPPCPLRVRSAPTCRDLDQVLSHVREIAVWAGTDGRVQDTGRFLLLDGERVWHSVAFGDSRGTELITRMRAIPGFDADLLLDAVRSRSGHIEPLWPPRVAAAASR